MTSIFNGSILIKALLYIHQGMNKTYLQLFSNCLLKPPVLLKILNEHKNLILPIIFL